MFAQKKTSPDIKSIDTYVPRGLLNDSKGLLDAQVTSEGLAPVRIYFDNGLIRNFEIIRVQENILKTLMLPRLIEPHTHIDKALSLIHI